MTPPVSALVALLAVLGPPTLGYAAGAWGRSGLGSAVAVLVGIAAVVVVGRLDVVDVVLAEVSFAFGAWAGAAGPRRAARPVATLLVTGLLAEVAVRLLFPAEPDTPNLELLLSDPRTYRDRCTWKEARGPSRGAALHLGDSMAAGYGLAPGEVFTDRLNVLDPSVQHVNLAEPNSGPDCALHLLRGVPEDAAPRAVLLYVFTGNDLEDVGTTPGHPFEPPLFELDASGALVPQIVESAGWSSRQLRGPAPLAIRVLAQGSSLGKHLASALDRARVYIARNFEVPQNRDPGEQLELMNAVLSALVTEADRLNAPLVIVILPTEDEVRAEELGVSAPSGASHDRLNEVAHRAGTKVVDLLPESSAWYSDLRDRMYLRRTPSDFHWSALAHQRFAEWEIVNRPWALR